MAVKTHTWISLWFLISAPIIFWDVGYLFMRPRSMVGGDLHWIWEPYGIYQEVDHIYGLKALQEGDGFPNAQSLLNVFETLLNLLYVYLAHARAWAGTPLIGFASATMTLWKTTLYWVQEYYCAGCSVKQNDLRTLLLFWILPNGVWLIVPSLIIWQLGKDIVDGLSSREVKAASQKKTKTK